MNVVFRKMQIQDIDEILILEKELFDDAWSRQSFIYEVNNAKYSYPYVLILNEIIIGYCVCWFFDKELHIGNFAIKDQYQGNGYGKLLMKNIFELFPNYKQAYLEVNVSNNPAIGLYFKYGFSILSTRKSYYPNGEDALVMVKKN